jgi:hypothetical protein
MYHFWITPCQESVEVAYYVDGESTPSLRFKPSLATGVGFDDQAAPWSQGRYAGKGAKSGSWFWNFEVPFSFSIKITLKANNPDALYTIVRGRQNAKISIPLNGIKYSKLIQTHTDATVQPLDFVNATHFERGTRGVIFMHTLSFSAPNLNSLEGCFHAILPSTHYDSWPGLVLSSGTEDFYSSGWYFSAGKFAFENSGLTHLSTADGSATVSAYKYFLADPFFFDDGVTFIWRNGDMSDVSGIKCYIISGGNTNGNPGVAHTIMDAWTYIEIPNPYASAQQHRPDPLKNPHGNVLDRMMP